jgi:Helicase associated domain
VSGRPNGSWTLPTNGTSTRPDPEELAKLWAYPLGQWVAEQRRAYGTGQMAGQRARRLEKLGMVWSPEESVLAYVEPGVTVHGMDVGRWLNKQRQQAPWQGLMDGQREHLEQLGIVPLLPEEEAAPKSSKAASGALERGVAAPWRVRALRRSPGPT